jgi:hypothetical protein
LGGDDCRFACLYTHSYNNNNNYSNYYYWMCGGVFDGYVFSDVEEEEEERLFRCRVFYTRKKTPRDKKGGGHVQQSTMDGWIVVGEREREMDD